MARLKATVAQIRAQCATDIRRRDVELQRLKRHIEGRRGRDGYGGQVGMVVITPGMSKGPQGKRKGETETDLESPAYSLKQETTDFLTQLSQGLSDENDALISLVRGTLATLRSLQGLPSDFGQTSENDAVPEGFESAPGFMGGPPSYEALASSTDEVLEHLRGLLTNPSFVPVEEVEIREEEIHRLREGWEKMAARWKEAVALMDGWKKRMVDTGDTINLDDLKVGLNLGSGIATALETQDMNHEGKADADESEILKNIHEDFEEPSNEGEENVSFGLEIDLHATGRVLGDKDANARQPPTSSKVWFSPIPEEVKENTSLLDFSNPKAPRFYASGMHLKVGGYAITHLK